jgi:hypothetical protein
MSRSSRFSFACQDGDALGLFACDADSRGLRHRAQPTGDALELAGVVHLARRDLGLQVGVEHDEVDPQPVDQPSALADERVAVISQQPDLRGVVVEEGDREPLDSLSENGAGDCSCVDLVGLARLAFAATRCAHELGCDSHDALACGDECLLEMVGKVAAVLDRPHDFRAEFVCPAQRFQMALLAGGDFSLAEQLPGCGVDCREWVASHGPGD